MKVKKLEVTQVSKADKYIRMVFNDALYYIATKYGVKAFMPTNEKLDNISRYHAYEYALIDGKLYRACYTLPYKELIEYYKKNLEGKEYQMNLFEANYE